MLRDFAGINDAGPKRSLQYLTPSYPYNNVKVLAQGTPQIINFPGLEGSILEVWGGFSGPLVATVGRESFHSACCVDYRLKRLCLGQDLATFQEK